VRRSDLSASWRAFLDTCRQLRFGSLHNVGIAFGQPGTGPAMTVSRTVKVPRDREPLPAADDPDYAVRREVLDLIDFATRLGTGTIERIDVVAGLPKTVHLHGDWEEVMRA
jgi:hypothetical protein